MTDESSASRPGLAPLAITCTSAQCESALHCFKPTRKMVREGRQGRCRECGCMLVDWHRVHGRDPEDIAYTFTSLKREMFRHHMWHVEIDIRAVNHARRKGFSELRVAVRKTIQKYIAPANPSFDGRQTPREGSGNVICYAQHATATCCRKCMEYWYGIPPCVELDDRDVAFFTELVMRYIAERLPDLTENGEHVPPVRRNH